MSELTIQKGNTIARIHSTGAELTDLRMRGEKVLFQGSLPQWPSCAPVLFPTVGRSYENKIEVDGTLYPMPMHGFAKLREFELSKAEADRAEYHLRSDAETLGMYPWKFDLRITHLASEEALTTTFQVTNMDDHEMYFALGGHPALCCDLDRGGWELRFEKEEELKSTQVSPEGIILSGEKREIENRENRIIPLYRELFAVDALIFENVRSSYVELADTVSGKTVRFAFEGFDDLAVWTLPRGYDAPFLCLEPWQGMGNRSGEGKELARRHGVQRLCPGGQRTMSYTFLMQK